MNWKNDRSYDIICSKEVVLLYHVAICDDADLDLQEMSSVAEHLLRERGLHFSIREFRSAAELIHAYHAGEKWDLLLLDILMAGQDGLQLAEALRAQGCDTDLVFVTISPEFALAGYSSFPVSYLLKPLTREKLAGVLDHCLERRQKHPPLILDTMGGGSVSVYPEELLYLEVFRKEVVIHCGGGSVSCQGPLHEVLARLPREQFYQCHRSYVVNLSFVTGIRRYAFLLQDGSEVPIAMRIYPQAQTRWMEFLA